jgi:hypothetical protein
MQRKAHHEKNAPAPDTCARINSLTFSGETYYGSHTIPENKFLTIRLTENEFNNLTHLADRYNTNKSALIRELIKNLIPG